MAQAMQVDLNEEVQVVEQPQARTLTPPTLKRKRSKNARQSADAEVRPRDGRAVPALSDEEEEEVVAVEGLRPTVEEAPPSPFEMRNRRMALKAVSSTVETLVNSGEAQKFLEHARRDRKRIEDAPPPQPQPQPQVIVRPGVIVRPEAIVPRSLCGPGPYLGPYSAVI